MPEFSPQFMAVVFFIYGLAWFVLGLTIALEQRRATALPLASSLKYLAIFGFLHSVVEWLDMILALAGSQQDLLSLRIIRSILLAASTLILAYFGVHLITNIKQKYYWLMTVPFVLFALWLIAMVIPHLIPVPRELTNQGLGLCLQCHRAASISYLLHSSNWVSSADILSRYFLYLPASFLAAWAMLCQTRWFKLNSFKQEARDSTVIVYAFIFNGLIAGLIVPPGPFFPATVLNYATFFRWFAIPPQILRALVALVLTFFMARTLNVFEKERRGQLRKALHDKVEAQQQALQSQEQVHKQLEEWNRNLEELVRKRTAEIDERNREVVILQERDRLAREMHDSLGQTLSYLGLKVVELEKLLIRGEQEKALASIQAMEVAVQNATAEVRESILSLKTSLKPGRGLLEAIEEYLINFGEQTGLQTEINIEGGAQLSLAPSAQVQILRIVQEALTNIRKHANARVARVKIGVGAKEVLLSVEDDGQGFNLDEVLLEPDQRFGLHTMRERAEEIGGSMTINTALGQGTRLTFRLPINQEGNDSTNHSPSGG